VAGQVGLMVILSIILGLIFGVRFLILKFRDNKKEAIKTKLEAEGYGVSNGAGKCFVCGEKVTFEEKESSLFCPECGWEREAAIRNRLEKDRVRKEVSKEESNEPESAPPLLKEELMNEKIVRYLAIGVGILITMAILHIDAGSFVDDGLFAWNIQDTMVFELLKHRNDEEIAYVLWFVCFGGGVFLSWKYRLKTAGILIKVIKTIHKKA
jgi:predicted RNA-binding Zn-ribbon protein involved in translation (DUF1610 family)